MNAELGALGNRIRDTYRRVASEDGPTEDEIKQALATLAGAWGHVAGSVSAALEDEEVKYRLRQAAGSFASALGATITELGRELQDGLSSEEE